MSSDLQEQREHILYKEDTNLDPQGFPKDATQQSTGARTGARNRSGGALARCWDNDVAVAAQLALGFEGCTPNDEAWATVKGLLGAKVVRKALAALCKDTNKEVGVQGTVKDQSLHDTGTLTQLHLSLGQGSGVPPVLFCLTQQQVLADLKPAYHAKSGSSSATLPSCKTPPPTLDGLSVNGGEVHK
jgi:hypothetical protein